MPDRLAVRGGLAGCIEVPAPQVVRLDAEQRRAATQDVLEDHHALRAAEPAEGGVRAAVGLCDPAVNRDVRYPVGIVDMAQRPGEHRFGQVQAPAAVAGQRRAQRADAVVLVEADLPGGQERVPLPGDGDVLGAVEPEADRAAGEHRTQRSHRGQAVRLELLPAEAAAHPQALHGDVVRRDAQDMRDDVLRFGRVLGAGLDEDLAVLVDQRQRGIRLQIEVLLPTQFELAAEPVRRALQGAVRVTPADGAWCALEAVRRDGVLNGDQRRKCPVFDLDGAGALPGGFQGLTEHPADGVPVVHDLAREQRLVMLFAGIVQAGHVVGGEHPDHTRDVVRGFHPQRGDQGVGVRRLDRPRMQRAPGAAQQILRVQGRTGDVQAGALVGDLQPDLRVDRPIRERSV